MKNSTFTSSLKYALFIVAFYLINFSLSAQDTLKVIIPDSVKTIITTSCTPCHTSDGGLLSRSKLNFTVWMSYSSDKQKEKAAKMNTELSEGKMPPKKARESHPELIPTPEQAAIIKRWSESIQSSDKK